MDEKDIPEGQPKIDLAGELNADWRDNLLKNPHDQRYQGPDLSGVLESVPEPGYTKAKKKRG